jgi:GxxExxY protein
MNRPQSHRDTEPELLKELTERIIGCAIAVHRALGPGLLEQLYESAICIEFDQIGLGYERQKLVPVHYKGHSLGEYCIDLVVEGHRRDQER